MGSARSGSRPAVTLHGPAALTILDDCAAHDSTKCAHSSMRRSSMQTSRSKVTSALLSVGVICLLALLSTYSTSAQQTKGKGKGDAKASVNPRISYPGYIGGVVQSEKGPEAGVWVIAETN